MSRKRARARARRGGALAATALSSVLPAQPVNPSILPQIFFGNRVPEEEEHRTHYGKALDLWRIDYAIRQAEVGAMREMTDISRETAMLDGHLSATLGKRLNRVAALPFDIQAAQGAGVNAGKADAYARFVRDQIAQIPRFRHALVRLAWAVFDARAGQEIGWRRLGADWAVTGLHWIHPRRISFGSRRDLRVVDPHQQSPQGFRDVGFALEDPRLPYKFITYSPQLYCDYPEREGLAPRCLYWSRFARYGVSERNLLLELFGRPWRVVRTQEGSDVGINTEAAKSAYENAKHLSAGVVARMPPGFTLDIHQPFSGAGQVSGDIIGDCQKVISKLILGNTGSTDAVSTGLGSSIGNAHLSEEDLIIASDAMMLAETIEDALTDAIIAVNFGPHELIHAPRFIIKTEAPLSTEEEGARIKNALEIGLRVSEEEARRKLGVREIHDGEPYLVRVTRPASFGMAPSPPANETVYPIGQAPAPGELAPAPDAGLDLPPGGDAPPLLPGGDLLPGAPPPPALPAATLDPDVDEPDSIQALCDQMNEYGVERCPHARTNRCPLCGIEVERTLEGVDAAGEPMWKIVWRPIRNQGLAAAKDAWVMLLSARQPELTGAELDAIAAAPLEELRRMVGAAGPEP